MRDVTTRRPDHSYPVHERRARLLSVLVAAVLVTASCGATTGTFPPVPSTTPYPSGATTGPDSTATPPPAVPTPSPAPTAPPAAWTRVTPGDVAQAATLVPTLRGASGVAPSTAFRLTSLDGRSPAELAARLVVEPAVAVRVSSTDGATAVVTPVTPLQPGTLYRIRLARADGSTEASWAAQVALPLAVTETTPGHESSAVPLDTGIEITFNQAGVAPADLKAHLRISPAVSGRIVASGRTLVFLPAKPLAKGRLYTVTITHGLPLAGTGQVLADDTIIRFETAAKPRSAVTLGFVRTVVDGTPRERTAMSVWASGPENDEGTVAAPASIPLTIHRLGSLEDAMAAAQAIASAPGFTQVSTTPAVPTTGLTRLFSGKVTLHHENEWGSYWIQLPQRLATGWYLVTETWGGVPRQIVAQITDLATFTMTTTTRSLVWVNNLRTGAAVAGASVAMGGTTVGTTDERGVMDATTPATVRAGEERWTTTFVVVRAGSLSRFEWLEYPKVCGTCAGGVDPSPNDWWHAFTSDRETYRTTDTMNLWGVMRGRESGTVPPSVVIELALDGDGGGQPTHSVTATPDAAGAFSASISYAGLPVGDYHLLLRVGDLVVSDMWTQIATIAKPGWGLEAAVTHRAVISGGTLDVAVAAAFFEGTPVAGARVGLVAGSSDQGDESNPMPEPVVVTTGSDGRTTATVPVAISTNDGQYEYATLEARPTLPEEGDISASTGIMVFRANGYVDAAAAVSGTRLTASGKASLPNLAGYDAPGTDIWSVDPRGAPIPNAAIRLKVVEVITVRHQTGTRYDFITKRVVPVYEYDQRETTVATRTVRTSSTGTFRTVFTVTGGDRAYRLEASYVDATGRRATEWTWADEAALYEQNTSPFLENATAGADDTYSVGDLVRVRVTDPAGAPAGARYLYAITHRGLQYVAVGEANTFRTTFAEAWAPGFDISAVRFTTHGYEMFVATFNARLQISDRALTVTVTPDKTRYIPGETATVTIRTAGPDGRPVAASVFVTAVDEKLFRIGAAQDVNPLEALYESVDSGITHSQHSHETPPADWGGKGDATGGDGGGRSDFRDWLVAKLIRTGTDGRATLPIALSDDLTSWHVTASGVDARLEAGIGTGFLAVGLPFFADVTLAPEYLAVDRPMVRVRAFGSGLAANEIVTFTVSSDTLLMAPVSVTAPAFTAVDVPLPALSAGAHRIRVEARAGSGATLRTDALLRSFTVVTTRATQQRTTWSALDGSMAVPSGGGITTLVLADAGRGRVIPVLEALAQAEGGRADRLIASALAARVLVDAFGLESPVPVDEAALQSYMRYDGLSVVPWGSASLQMTAHAAMAGETRINWSQARELLQVSVQDTVLPRVDRLLALAALAALHEPVLADIAEAAALSDLTPHEEAVIALAALYAGDEDLARHLERTVIADHALRQGPWVRLDLGSVDAAKITTARLAIVAATLGDPIAAEMDAWLAEFPPTTTTVDVERALGARGWAERTAGATAVAALTVDGVRREVRVEPGAPVSVSLTPAQAVGARLEPVSGSTLVVSTWTDTLSAISLTALTGQSLVRTVKPAGSIGETDVVEVTLKVALGAKARNECWRVTDLVPSGLRPITGAGTFVTNDQGEPVWTGTSPDTVDGQRVEFCVSRVGKTSTFTLRYVARVVTPGTYLWEPAVLQSTVVPDEGVVGVPTTVTITGTGG